MLKVLDLFSGIGGFSLGLERTGGFKTVAFCEIDPFCRKVLAKHWPGVPIHEDVRALEGNAMGHVDIITGGYPCQPFSLAGQRRGEADDRHLWPEMARLIAAVQPAWVIAENVAGHINMGLDDVLSDLEGRGYTATALVIPACAVNAPHRRDRVWIVANSGSRRRNKPTGGEGQQSRRAEVERRGQVMAHAPQLQRDGCGEHSQQSERQIPKPGKRGSASNVANAPSPRQSDCRGGKAITRFNGDGTANNAGCGSRGGAEWLPEPDVGRVAARLPNGVDRLRALGNAVVPQIPEIIGRAILEATT